MKIYISLLLLVFSLHSFSQNISGQAFYESKTTVDLDAFGNNREMTDDMKKMIAERMKSMLEKTYILTFNKEESIYKEEVKLDANPMNAGLNMMIGSFTPGIQYKNLKTGELIQENEFFGKQFLVTDSIDNLDWKLGKESKQIGEYVVFKATAIKRVDPNDFQMARPKKKDDQEKDDAKKEESQDPMDMIEIPKEIEVTAWYTPQIPVSNGPGEYAGLPGLIMELNFYRTTLLCSKIVMNPNNPDKIERPKKGKKVSQEEYAAIVKEKMEELRENFRNSGGRRGGGF